MATCNLGQRPVPPGALHIPAQCRMKRARVRLPCGCRSALRVALRSPSCRRGPRVAAYGERSSEGTAPLSGDIQRQQRRASLQSGGREKSNSSGREPSLSLGDPGHCSPANVAVC